jgi:hypothetical protein
MSRIFGLDDTRNPVHDAFSTIPKNIEIASIALRYRRFSSGPNDKGFFRHPAARRPVYSRNVRAAG